MGPQEHVVSPLVSPVAPDPPATLDPRKEIEDHWNMRRVKDFEGTLDHLKVLLNQEATSYAPCLDYLAALSSATTSDGSTSSPSEESRAPVDTVNEAWRRRLCEWCFEVVDHFSLEREVVSIALNYLDRIVAKSIQSSDYAIAKREFQLVAVSSLYVAIKLHGENDEIDLDRRKLNIEVFVELSRGFFQVETLEAMELSILFNLNWQLNPPTPLKFISSLIRLIPAWTIDEYQPSYRRVSKAIFDISMYLTELSVCVSTFTFHSKNSIVAYAAILCAIDSLDDSLPLPYDVRMHFVNNVAEATGLLPEMEKVRCVRNLLMELCPSIEERDVSSLIVDEDDGGKSSPVCVSHIVQQDDMDGARKRIRS